jgi:hypothetical protein
MPTYYLNQRLRTAVTSARFAHAARGAPDRPQQITNHGTQAVLGELVRLIPSARVLEIGTYFADTSRYLAEIMADIGGELITIDPFGGARVPGIMAGWPGALQQRVTFRPDNSMAFFLRLEERHTPIGEGGAVRHHLRRWPPYLRICLLRSDALGALSAPGRGDRR